MQLTNSADPIFDFVSWSNIGSAELTEPFLLNFIVLKHPKHIHKHIHVFFSYIHLSWIALLPAETPLPSCFGKTAALDSTSTLPHSRGWGSGGAGSNRHSPQSTRSERLGKETLDVSVTEHSLQKALIVDQKRERVKMEATGQPPDSTRACTLPFKGLRVDSFLLSIQKYQSSNYECQPLLCFWWWR